MHALTYSLNRWKKPEDQTNQRRDADAEAENGSVDSNLADPRETRRTERHQRADSQISDKDADESADRGKHEVFRKQLANDSTSTCAQSRADRKLSLAARPA